MQFSSTYHDSTINPFPASSASATSTFPSSSSYPYTLPFLIDIPENHDFANNNNTSSLLDHEHPFVVPFIPITHIHDAAPFPEETTIANLAADCTAMLESSQDNNNTNNINGCYGGGGVGATFGGISIPNFLTQKPAISKKDRHSKIHTSQGLRDRRVRLSSEIARKFFDLQDMLEFDKPSNTLEWLFTKSENAIKELARSKHHSCSEKCSCHDSNNKSNMTGGGDGSAKGRNKLKWSTQRDQDAAASCVQSKKESRERARARARERTCYYKMCSNSTTAGSRVVQQHHQQDQLLEEIIRCPAAAPIQSTTEADEEANCERWRQLVQQQPYPYEYDGELAAGHCRDHGSFNVIEESIMIKRNMMSSSHNSHSHHQQNYLANIPKEASFINNNNNNIDIDHYPLFPYSTPNWDANNGYYSNFCGIATMNLSTCFMNQCFFKLNFGNSWEERNNQSRHN